MKQKTTIDLIIEKINYLIDVTGPTPALNDILEYSIEIKKTTEREQIYEAFVAGDQRGTGEIPFNCEQYYNQTYKP